MGNRSIAMAARELNMTPSAVSCLPRSVGTTVIIPTAIRFYRARPPLRRGLIAWCTTGWETSDQNVYQTAATPIQNNGYMHAVIYTYAKGPWIISPYFQYGKLPTNAKVGVVKGTSATGGAINASYAFKSGFSLPARVEYLSSSGSATDGSVNLLGFGAGSAGTTFTATPTYQKGGLYLRSDLAVVHAIELHAGRCLWQQGNGREPIPGRT